MLYTILMKQQHINILKQLQKFVQKSLYSISLYTRLGKSVTTQSGSGRQYVGSGRQYVTGS